MEENKDGTRPDNSNSNKGDNPSSDNIPMLPEIQENPEENKRDRNLLPSHSMESASRKADSNFHKSTLSKSKSSRSNLMKPEVQILDLSSKTLQTVFNNDERLFDLEISIK